MCFVVLLAYSFIVFVIVIVFVSFAPAVVTNSATSSVDSILLHIGVINSSMQKGFCGMCEIFSLLTMIIFSRKERKERKVLFTFRISRLRWSGRKLRYDKSSQSGEQ